MSSEAYSKVLLYRRIVKAKLFIDEHYAEPIDLSAIADEAYFSKFHFIRLFKTAYGKTPHHYLIQVRIDRAQELLSQGRTVADASFLVGFESSTSFATLFKRQTGLSPSAYQTRQFRKRSLIRENPLQVVPNCFAEKHAWKG